MEESCGVVGIQFPTNVHIKLRCDVILARVKIKIDYSDQIGYSKIKSSQIGHLVLRR